jgi:hypothetical protein
MDWFILLFRRKLGQHSRAIPLRTVMLLLYPILHPLVPWLAMQVLQQFTCIERTLNFIGDI